MEKLPKLKLTYYKSGELFTTITDKRDKDQVQNYINNSLVPLVEAKQDHLIAGEGIKILDNTISTDGSTTTVKVDKDSFEFRGTTLTLLDSLVSERFNEKMDYNQLQTDNKKIVTAINEVDIHAKKNKVDIEALKTDKQDKLTIDLDTLDDANQYLKVKVVDSPISALTVADNNQGLQVKFDSTDFSLPIDNLGLKYVSAKPITDKIELKQDITDSALVTNVKTIVPAINELYQDALNLNSKITTNTNAIKTITSDISALKFQNFYLSLQTIPTGINTFSIKLTGKITVGVGSLFDTVWSITSQPIDTNKLNPDIQDLGTVFHCYVLNGMFENDPKVINGVWTGTNFKLQSYHGLDIEEPDSNNYTINFYDDVTTDIATLTLDVRPLVDEMLTNMTPAQMPTLPRLPNDEYVPDPSSFRIEGGYLKLQDTLLMDRLEITTKQNIIKDNEFVSIDSSTDTIQIKTEPENTLAQNLLSKNQYSSLNTQVKTILGAIEELNTNVLLKQDKIIGNETPTQGSFADGFINNKNEIRIYDGPMEPVARRIVKFNVYNDLNTVTKTIIGGINDLVTTTTPFTTDISNLQTNYTNLYKIVAGMKKNLDQAQDDILALKSQIGQIITNTDIWINVGTKGSSGQEISYTFKLGRYYRIWYHWGDPDSARATDVFNVLEFYYGAEIPKNNYQSLQLWEYSVSISTWRAQLNMKYNLIYTYASYSGKQPLLWKLEERQV